MAFVSEKIPSEERYKIRDIRTHFGGCVYDDVEVICRWVIDRERDVFLLPTGGGNRPEIPNFYAFSRQGRVLYITAEERVSGSSYHPQGMDLYRRIINFVMPPYFEAQREQVMQLVKEAFDVWGYASRSENVRVHLEIYDPKTGVRPWL